MSTQMLSVQSLAKVVLSDKPREHEKLYFQHNFCGFMRIILVSIYHHSPAFFRVIILYYFAI